MDLGFIKLHRKLMDWEWYTCPNMVQFFIHCLFRAGHKASKFRGVELEAGQFISGRKTLSLQTGLSEQNVRTCIKNLVLTNEITTKNLGVNTLFTINSWKNYQTKTESNYMPTKEITKCQPSANQVPTTNKKVKECKEGKNKELVIPFEEHFPESHKTELFLKSWCEWIEHRKQKKSKVTESMAKKQLNFLGQFSVVESISSLENSMMNGYTGLFEPKRILKKESRDEELDRLIAEEYGK